MSGRVLRVRDLRLRRGDAHDSDAASSFDVERGELVALMGPSGSGKTTILRAIAGLEPFEPGAIEVDGVTLERRRRSRRRRCGSCAARSAWCSSSIACSST